MPLGKKQQPGAAAAHKEIDFLFQLSRTESLTVLQPQQN